MSVPPALPAAGHERCAGGIYGFGIFPLEPRTLVPTAGMLLGNTIAATVLASRHALAELDTHRDEIEVRLSLGQTGRQAVRPHLAEAMRTAVTPPVEQTKIVGLIALPGTMTGFLLAGAAPLDAVLTQTVVMFLTLGSVAVTTVLVGRGTARRLVSDDHRLLTEPAPSSLCSPQLSRSTSSGSGRRSWRRWVVRGETEDLGGAEPRRARDDERHRRRGAVSPNTSSAGTGRRARSRGVRIESERTPCQRK